VMNGAIAKVKVDQALIRNTRFLRHRLEIGDSITV